MDSNEKNRRAETQGLSPDGHGPEPESSVWLRWGLIFYAAMGGVALLWRWGFEQEPVWFVSREAAEQGGAPGRNIMLGLLVGGALVLVSQGLTSLTDWGRRLERAMGESLGALKVSHALVLACASSLGEEMLFRGALQPTVGWALASLCFGLVHFVPRRDFLPWTLFAIVAGGILGGLVVWTGNLLAAVVAHAVVNGVNLPILARRYGGQGAPPPGSA